MSAPDVGAQDATQAMIRTVAALRQVSSGRTYDLSSGWWHRMPLSPFHPPFQVLTYRSPSGIRNAGDVPFLADNPQNIGIVTELIMGTAHSGTHIDALAHSRPAQNRAGTEVARPTPISVISAL